MIHRKKCIPSLFEDVRTGKKRFEVRLADFEVNLGDKMVLEEWIPEESAYTGRTCTIEIEYILKTKDMPAWTPEKVEEFGFQILQIKSVE
jgi:ASC-1-like (ASCH) protein